MVGVITLGSSIAPVSSVANKPGAAAVGIFGKLISNNSGFVIGVTPAVFISGVGGSALVSEPLSITLVVSGVFEGGLFGILESGVCGVCGV